MKKTLLTVISLLICTSLFANKVTVSPVKTSYNEIKTGSNGVLKQTVYSSSGMEITVSAELEDDNLKYNLELDNITDPTFLQRQDTIKTYFGNFEKNEWTENTAQSFSKNKDNNKSYDKQDSLNAAETLLLAGSACVCAFTLFEICQQTSKSSNTPKTRNVTSTTRRPAARAPAVRTPAVRTPAAKRSPQIAYRGPTFSWIIVDPVIITTTENRRSRPEDFVDPDILTEDDRIILQEEEPEVSRYSGCFYVPAGIGPDYRLRVIVSSDEYIDFYFSRSDRDNVANPMKDRNYGRHSLVFSMGIPDFTRMGGYYIYSGKYVGFYTGITMQLESWDISPIAEIDGSDFGAIKIKTKAPSNSSFIETNESMDLHDYINLNFGLTIKTVPHTWLMLGCGMDMLIDYNYGKIIENEGGTVVANGYLADYMPDIFVVPQVGVNFIFDHIDIAGTFQYSFIKGPTFDCMVGIAF